MIKKIIGVIFILAVLAIIAFALLGAGSYKSMVPDSVYQAIGLTLSAQDVDTTTQQ